MIIPSNNADLQINDLLISALQLKHCKGCPNINRVKNVSEYGIYPRWGAGTVNAPIILILERPGNQYYLSETGQTAKDRAKDIQNLRQEFTEIMLTAYDDGVRYLEGILLYLYGSKARKFSFLTRVKLLAKLAYITELIKCPGDSKDEVKICPQQYLKKEWQLITTLPELPVLTIIATRSYNNYFPSNFPSEIRKGEKQFFNWNGISFLHIKHPSGLKYIKEYERETIHKAVADYRLKADDARTTLMIKTAYILNCLIQMDNSKDIQMKILERLKES